jgi:hypothetical protein
MKEDEMYDEVSYPARGYRGGRGGGGHHGHGRGRGAGFRAGAYAGPAPESAAALRQALFATVAAARQVAVDGDPDKAAKATELLNEVRKGLYRMLAGEAG